MARKKISELTARTTFDDDCDFPVHDLTQTWRVNALKILDYIRAALQPAVNAKTANYAILSTDYVVTMDATAGVKTLTLPTAVGCSGKTYVLKKIDSSSNTVQVLTTSAQTVDGNASGALYMRAQWDTIKVISNGTNWLILSMNFGIAGGNFLVSY